MNSKIKAGALTVTLGTICVTVALILQSVTQYMTLDQFMTGVAVAGSMVCVYMIYLVLLSHFEYKDHLNSQVDKK